MNRATIPDVAPFRTVLAQKRTALLAGFAPRLDAPAVREHAEEDQAQISHDEFISLRLNSLDYMQLRLIDEALDRIDTGDYGTCLGCERPIPAKRLSALPWARYCVECQERAGMHEERGIRNDRPRIPLPGR